MRPAAPQRAAPPFRIRTENLPHHDPAAVQVGFDVIAQAFLVGTLSGNLTDQHQCE